MNNLLNHRGPDNSDYWIRNKYIGLGHTRLSIIDLNKKSNQPMKIKNYVLIFNGEIYNYKILKDKIKDKWNFRTESDTEVIIALYDIYKDKCLDYLDGMFSFALWDDTEKTLFCARDRIGIKPFYYLIQNNVFYFSSEVKALIPFFKYR